MRIFLEIMCIVCVVCIIVGAYGMWAINNSEFGEYYDFAVMFLGEMGQTSQMSAVERLQVYAIYHRSDLLYGGIIGLIVCIVLMNLQNVAERRAVNQQSYRHESWLCPKCGTYTMISKGQCSSCGAPKPPKSHLQTKGQDMPVITHSAVYNAETKEAAPPWVCPVCKNLNKAKSATCTRCGQDKPD